MTIEIGGTRFQTALKDSGIDICDPDQDKNPVISKTRTIPGSPNVWENLAEGILQSPTYTKEYAQLSCEAKTQVKSKLAEELDTPLESKKLSELVGWGEKPSWSHWAYCLTYDISWLPTNGLPVPNTIKLDIDVTPKQILKMIEAKLPATPVPAPAPPPAPTPVAPAPAPAAPVAPPLPRVIVPPTEEASPVPAAQAEKPVSAEEPAGKKAAPVVKKGICDGKVDDEVLADCNKKCTPSKNNSTALSKCIAGYK